MLLRRLSSVSIRTQYRANSTLSADLFFNSSQPFAFNNLNNITNKSQLLTNTINATKSIYNIIQNELINLKSSYFNTPIFEDTAVNSSINNSIHDNISDIDSIYMTSTMKRRKRKMNKHKKRKLMKRLRANTKQSRQG